MGSKRRKSISKQGYNMFAPDCEPCYSYGGKVLTNDYDKRCFREGWLKAENLYDLRIEDELKELERICCEDLVDELDELERLLDKL